MKADEIRGRFIDYFKRNDHRVVPSSPLVPKGDPTLLFTNAGMVPFKGVFLGREESASKRVVSIQKCMRAGGKHNDL
ncbi:MAG: alanine--tRNA ligase-related protein, partial [Thermodesulfobacteriota bacterium]